MKLQTQKYIFISGLLALNAVLCGTFGYYPDKWYAFMFVLGVGTAVHSISALLLILNYFRSSVPYQRKEARNIIYLVPCYNESYDELYNTLTSLTSQCRRQGFDEYTKLVIVCDGRVNNTDTALKLMLCREDYTLNVKTFTEVYTSIKNERVNLEINQGEFHGMPFTLMIKDTNQGKRDSITLVRRLVYGESSLVPFSLTEAFNLWLNGTLHYIIGIDADTIFDPMCTEELINGIESGGPDCKGCVGFVDIPRKWTPFVMYQYAEYHFGQLLRRRVQSEVTHKVNCLSGCNQIIKVCRETCGDELMNRYTEIPEPDGSIFSHIRSYASEDRNHVCLMLSMYPWVRTVQNIRAVAYTRVPESVRVFLSQRRRWTLGAMTNDMLLTYLKGINLLERVSALVNIVTFGFNPFIVAATGFFINAIIHARTDLMLYLSIPMIIPFAYTLVFTPLIRGFYPVEILYFYLSYVMYLILGLPASLIIYVYALLGMDTIKWGKTRQVIKPESSNNDLMYEEPFVVLVEDADFKRETFV